MISQTVVIEARIFITQPRNRRLKKKTAVCKSMQKKAQPRFTIVNVNAQAANLPARERKGVGAFDPSFTIWPLSTTRSVLVFGPSLEFEDWRLDITLFFLHADHPR